MPPGKNLFVGRLHVGVRAENGRNFAIEKPAERDFLARRFAMNIDHDDRSFRAHFRNRRFASRGNGFSRIGSMKVRHCTLITPTFPFAVSSTIEPCPGAPSG